MTVFVDEIVAAVNHVDIASGTEGGAGALQPSGIGQIVGIQKQYEGRAQLSGRAYAQVTRQPGTKSPIGIDDSPPRSQHRLNCPQMGQRHFAPGVIVHDDQHPIRVRLLQDRRHRLVKVAQCHVIVRHPMGHDEGRSPGFKAILFARHCATSLMKNPCILS